MKKIFLIGTVILLSMFSFLLMMSNTNHIAANDDEIGPDGCRVTISTKA